MVHALPHAGSEVDHIPLSLSFIRYTVFATIQGFLYAQHLGTFAPTACACGDNPFPILRKPTLLIDNKPGTLKIPHEDFKRGCTNFKRSQTIINKGGF